MVLKNYIKVGTRKYAYDIHKIDESVSRVVCRDAKIDQEFLNEDIVGLLVDLPKIIAAEKKYQEKQDSVIRFRVTSMEKAKIRKKFTEQGYTNMSAYIKDKVLS